MTFSIGLKLTQKLVTINIFEKGENERIFLMLARPSTLKMLYLHVLRFYFNNEKDQYY